MRIHPQTAAVKRGYAVKARLWALVLLLLLPGVEMLKGAGTDVAWLGVLWTKGDVSVGGAKVSSGTTVLPRDVITTAQSSSAWLRFRAPASALLMGDTQVSLLANNAVPGLVLNRGTVVLDEKLADPIQVNVPGAQVWVKGDPQTGAQCQVAAAGGAATIAVVRGLAEVHAPGGPVILHPGQSVRVEADPQGSQPVAGRISREIPQGKIQREGQIQELPLKLNETINWNDLVTTLQAGRAQIKLVDGSTLNVGARSSIKILKHDPQKQQTEIDVALGEVQANVQKITVPGGKFELHTKSAIIGTVDTSFVASSDEKGTRVCGVDGTTKVTSSDPNIKKEVRLKRKQCTYVPLGGAPTDPVFSPSEFSTLMSQTAVQSAAGGISTETLVTLAEAGGVGAAVAGIVLASPGATSPTAP